MTLWTSYTFENLKHLGGVQLGQERAWKRILALQSKMALPYYGRAAYQ